MPESRDPPEPTPRAKHAPPEAGLDRWIDPFFSDSMLWPVLIVLVTAFAIFGAAVLLLAVRTRSFFAIAALLVLVVASAEALRSDLHRRRVGRAGGLILVLWTLSALLALAAARFGML